MKDCTQPGSIVGRYGIAQMFGFSRESARNIIEDPDFPAPIDTEGKHETPLFWRRDVERFKAERERQAAAESPAAA